MGTFHLAGRQLTGKGSRAAWGTYRDITARLRAQIASGDLNQGAPMPSEAELGAEYGVSRTTARRALAALEQEGLVVTVPGRARTVRDTDSSPAPAESAASRIARHVAERIASGHLQPGDRLPSEHALAAEHGVSRSTVRQALAVLADAGRVEVVQGRGRYVAPAAQRGTARPKGQ